MKKVILFLLFQVICVTYCNVETSTSHAYVEGGSRKRTKAPRKATIPVVDEESPTSTTEMVSSKETTEIPTLAATAISEPAEVATTETTQVTTLLAASTESFSTPDIAYSEETYQTATFAATTPNIPSAVTVTDFTSTAPIEDKQNNSAVQTGVSYTIRRLDDQIVTKIMLPYLLTQESNETILVLQADNLEIEEDVKGEVQYNANFGVSHIIKYILPKTKLPTGLYINTERNNSVLTITTNLADDATEDTKLASLPALGADDENGVKITIPAFLDTEFNQILIIISNASTGVGKNTTERNLSALTGDSTVGIEEELLSNKTVKHITEFTVTPKDGMGELRILFVKGDIKMGIFASFLEFNRGFYNALGFYGWIILVISILIHLIVIIISIIVLLHRCCGNNKKPGLIAKLCRMCSTIY